MSSHVCYSPLETKILAALPLFAHELQALFTPKGKKSSRSLLALQVPTQPPAAPYWVCDLPEDAFAAVLSLCEAGQISFTTVSAMMGKQSVVGHALRCPLVSLSAKAGEQCMLPLRILPGIVPGEPGGGAAGRFFRVEAGITFRWNEASKAAKQAKKAVKAVKKVKTAKSKVKTAKAPKKPASAAKKVPSKKPAKAAKAVKVGGKK